MKKAIIALLALSFLQGFSFAEELSRGGMLLRPGTIDLSAGLGWAWIYDFEVGVGCEYIIGKFEVAKDVPLEFGAAARAALFSGYLDSAPIAIGAFGTLHFNWGALKLPDTLSWLRNADSYIGLGAEFLPGFRPDAIAGLSYFFIKSLAVNAETGIGGTQIGLLLKL